MKMERLITTPLLHSNAKDMRHATDAAKLDISSEIVRTTQDLNRLPMAMVPTSSVELNVIMYNLMLPTPEQQAHF